MTDPNLFRTDIVCPNCKAPREDLTIIIRETLYYNIKGADLVNSYVTAGNDVFDGDNAKVEGIECNKCNTWWRDEKEFTDAVKRSEELK